MSLTNSCLSRHVRKAIARVNTVITQVDRTEAKAQFAGKKFLPIDLRQKKTRAIRRRLTKDEASRKTVRQQRKLYTAKPLKYAVKAI
jgi:large subunit ribosomal protein L35e